MSTLFTLFTFSSFAFLLIKNVNKLITDKYSIFKTKLSNSAFILLHAFRYVYNFYFERIVQRTNNR